MTNVSLLFLQKYLAGQFFFHQIKCGWLWVIYGECGWKRVKILKAGESRELRMSPVKCGWLGIYANASCTPSFSDTYLVLGIQSKFIALKLSFWFWVSPWKHFSSKLSSRSPAKFGFNLIAISNGKPGPDSYLLYLDEISRNCPLPMSNGGDANYSPLMRQHWIILSLQLPSSSLNHVCFA